MTDLSLRYVLALLRMPGMGPVKLSGILAQYPDPSVLFEKQSILQSPFQTPVDWRKVDEDLEWAKSENCYILTLQDPRYPSRLKEIYGAPPVLFAKGKIELLDRPQIAIVGSRNPTPSGIEIATQFARSLSSLGLTVTSGLALGIDASAHRAALFEKGSSIAVLGNGLKQIYPKCHAALFHEMVEKGLLVSEFPLEERPLASHFPRRNRLISGLTLGTLVVEAALKSGSLITAQYAAEQGREIFAIPGSIHSPLSKGCHQLIREGAKLVESLEDVLEELGVVSNYCQSLWREKARVRVQPSTKALQKVLEQVGYEATPLDWLLLRCGLTISELSSKLLDLELEGFIVSVPGGYSRVDWKPKRD